jgi:hypothetical protein
VSVHTAESPLIQGAEPCAVPEPVVFAPAPLDRPPTSKAISSARQMVIRVINAWIMFITGIYVGVDWSGYFYGFKSSFPIGAGYARTCLCALVVLIIGKNHLTRLDQRLLAGAFVLTLIADYFLILVDEMLIGTLIFIGVHVLFIARHAQGWRASMAVHHRARTIRWLVLTAVVAYGGAGILILDVADILKRTGRLPLDATYLVFLATSMWMAWGVLIRRFYPRRNAWFIAVGMTSFYCCDVTVGLAAAMQGTRAGAILNNIVGFFYSPALVLIAFSGVRWPNSLPPRSVREPPVAPLKSAA